MHISSSNKKGYALSILLIALVVISFAVIAAIPVLSIKKDIFANTSVYVKDCIENQNAADLNSTACLGTISGIVSGFNKDYESVMYYLNNAAYTDPALTIIKQACDQGAEKACNVFLDRCVADTANCDLDAGGSDNRDIAYYMSLPSNDNSNKGKVYLVTKGIEYYLQGIPNLNSTLDNICNTDMASAACDVTCETKTITYNFNSSQRGNFFESDSSLGTDFYEGIITLQRAASDPIEWTKHYGGTNVETPNSSVITPDGNYIYIVGSTQSDTSGSSDAYVMKISTADGATSWKKRYGTGNTDWAGGITMSSDGTYLYITGNEYADAAGEAYVLKLNSSDGTTVWKNRYGGAGVDIGNDIVISPDNSYVYVGGREGSDKQGGEDVFLLKLDSLTGTATWKKRYSSSSAFAGTDSFSKMKISSDGNDIYMTGAMNNDIFIARVSTATGVPVWKKRYGGTAVENPSSLALSPDGNYVYLAGHTWSTSDPHFFISQVNISDGTPNWIKYWDGDAAYYSDTISDLIVSPDSNYVYVTGTETSYALYDKNVMINEASSDIYVMKISSDGETTVWSKNYGGVQSEKAYQIEISPDGSYLYVVGDETSDSAGSFDMVIIKLNETQTTGFQIFKYRGINQTVAGNWLYNGVDWDATWMIDGADIKAASDLSTAAWVTGGISLIGGTGTPLAATWTINGVDIDARKWYADSMDMDATKWLAGYNFNNSAYFTTTSNNNISEIVGGIKNSTFSAYETLGTGKIRTLVSFDNQANWYKWDGSNWNLVTNDLNTFDFSNNGNTLSEMQIGLTNYQATVIDINTGTTSLDLAFYLEITSDDELPYMDSISVTYLKKRRHY